MYCEKCGSQVDPNSKFCDSCGAPIESVSDATPSAPLVNPNKNKIIGLSVVGVVALAVIILLVSLLGGRGYKATVNKFVDAIFSANAKAIVNLMPKKIVDDAIDDGGYDNKSELIEEGEEALQDALSYLHLIYGDDWKIKRKIEDSEDITDRELRNIKEDYEEYDVKVTAAKTVEVVITFKADGDEQSNTMYVNVIKVGSSWYIDFLNMNVF